MKYLLIIIVRYKEDLRMVKVKEENLFIKRFRVLLMCLCMGIAVMFSGVVSYATSNGNDTAAAESSLRKGAKDYFGSSGEYKDKTYELSGGGWISGYNLFTDDNDIDEDKFNQLTGDAQTAFVEDFATACNDINDGSDVVTDETVDNWWKQLQKKKGMGSKFLSQVLADTKPDFVTAKKWYQPFSGPIGTLLAFGSIIALALLGLVMVADILYITIPPLRFFVDDKGEDGKVAISKLFSHAAISAVKQAEESSDGKHKQALGIYFKSRVVELIILGICLLYLVQGEIYTLVGWILDLLSGFTS